MSGERAYFPIQNLHIPHFQIANLRATTGTTDSDERFHDGLKLLSESVTAGIRNITAHEPVLADKKEDCIDILHLLSFLYRQLDKSVNIKNFNSST